jgi:hypothetical protein
MGSDPLGLTPTARRSPLRPRRATSAPRFRQWPGAAPTPHGSLSRGDGVRPCGSDPRAQRCDLHCETHPQLGQERTGSLGTKDDEVLPWGQTRRV